MNPGYLSLILMCMVVILFSSGWKTVLIPGTGDRSLLAFIVCWLVLSRVHIPWPNHPNMQIGLVFLFVIYVAMHHIATRPNRIFGLHLVSIGLFLASIYYLMKHLSLADPLFFPYHSRAAAAIGVGLIAVLLSREAKDQIAVVSIGIVAGSGLYTFVHLKSASVVWGGNAFQDEWWAAVAAVRVASICLQSAWLVGFGVLRRWKSKDEQPNPERRE